MDSRIRATVYPPVPGITLGEQFQASAALFSRRRRRDYPPDQHLSPFADKISIGIYRMLRETSIGEDCVGGFGEIAEGIDEGTVEIEDRNLI
jgi:hypothetical protein